MYTPVITELSRATAHPAQRVPISADRRPHEARTARPELVVARRPAAGRGGLGGVS